MLVSGVRNRHAKIAVSVITALRPAAQALDMKELNMASASAKQIKTIINQATSLFDSRDEAAVLESVIDRFTEQGIDPSDFADLATEIIDTFRHAITDARDEEALDLEELRNRLEEIESLPEAWWNESHPMYPYLDEFIDERRELRWLFEEFDDVIAQEDHTTLLPHHMVGDYVLRIVSERSGMDVESLDPALRASINKDELIEHFRKDGGTLQGVELYGSTWLLGN